MAAALVRARSAAEGVISASTGLRDLSVAEFRVSVVEVARGRATLPALAVLIRGRRASPGPPEQPSVMRELSILRSGLFRALPFHGQCGSFGLALGCSRQRVKVLGRIFFHCGHAVVWD